MSSKWVRVSTNFNSIISKSHFQCAMILKASIFMHSCRLEHLKFRVFSNSSIVCGSTESIKNLINKSVGTGSTKKSVPNKRWLFRRNERIYSTGHLPGFGFLRCSSSKPGLRRNSNQRTVFGEMGTFPGLNKSTSMSSVRYENPFQLLNPKEVTFLATTIAMFFFLAFFWRINRATGSNTLRTNQALMFSFVKGIFPSLSAPSTLPIFVNSN